jgi:hypothetical protein
VYASLEGAGQGELLRGTLGLHEKLSGFMRFDGKALQSLGAGWAKE